MDKLLRRLIGEDVQLVTFPARGLAPVTADPGQVEHVIAVLAVNARDAMPRGGTLTIATSNVELAKHEILSSGPHVALTVTYTGELTGHGLDAVHAALQQADGTLEIDVSPGEATTFRILLPAAAQALPVRPATAAAAGLEGTETLLLVEDEAMVRDLVRRLLESYGYAVLEARNGAEALEVAGAHDARIDLVLTDVVMPQLSGPDLAARLCHLRPGLRVIFMSGYTEEKLDPQGVLEPHVQFLAKPFTPDALARKVREVLDDTGVTELRKAS
jgi:two-component system cell cycle sensor histidine kinase/response regulator CckA